MCQVLYESDNLVGEGEEIGAFKVLQVNTTLTGDIVFACKILPNGPHAGELLFRYAFHAGFTSPAPVRITAPKLDAPQVSTHLPMTRAAPARASSIAASSTECRITALGAMADGPSSVQERLDPDFFMDLVFDIPGCRPHTLLPTVRVS